MSAIDAALGVAIHATQTEVPDLVAAHATVEAFVSAVDQQLQNCQARVTELVATLSACTDTVDVLAAKAKELECVFRKIDRLESSMDVIHQRIVLLSTSVKTIEAPTDVKERAANFLMSVFRTKTLEDHGSSKHAWNRVPNYVMLDGMVPNDFVGAIRKDIEKLVADSEA